MWEVSASCLKPGHVSSATQKSLLEVGLPVPLGGLKAQGGTRGHQERVGGVYRLARPLSMWMMFVCICVFQCWLERLLK